MTREEHAEMIANLAGGVVKKKDPYFPVIAIRDRDFTLTPYFFYEKPETMALRLKAA